PKRELCPVGILEPQLAVANDPGAVQDTARGPGARSQRPEGINYGSGAVRVDIVDDQRGAGVRVPGRIAPHPEKTLVKSGDRRRIGDPKADAPLAKYAA